MNATINGTARELPAGVTVSDLLDLLGSRRAGVAVARNDRVVTQGRYDSDRLREGDRVEIIEAVAGG